MKSNYLIVCFCSAPMVVFVIGKFYFNIIIL